VWLNYTLYWQHDDVVTQSDALKLLIDSKHCYIWEILLHVGCMLLLYLFWWTYKVISALPCLTIVLCGEAIWHRVSKKHVTINRYIFCCRTPQNTPGRGTKQYSSFGRNSSKASMKSATLPANSKPPKWWWRSCNKNRKIVIVITIWF